MATRLRALTSNVAPSPRLLAGLVGLTLSCSPEVVRGEERELPDVIVVLADDMGWGDPACYGDEEDAKIPTPAIDRLAREGLRFTDAHSPCGVCVQSRYGLLTGRYPFRTSFPWRERPCIAADRPTVASYLSAAGYRTAMVGKWHLGFHLESYDEPIRGGPVDRGFDEFLGIPASTDIPPYYWITGDRVETAPTKSIEANSTEGWSPIQGAFWRAGKIAPDMELADVLPRITERAVRTISKHQAESPDRPLFLYVAFPAPHTPWLPSEEFRGKSGASLYGDFTMMVDASLGRILEAVDAAGRTERTLFVFTSDNGPTWYDRDVERLGHDSAGGLRGMKGDAWEGGHRVPFIVRWPRRVEAGRTTDQLVGLIDVFATVADVVGRELPPEAAQDSVSFLDVLTGGRPESDPVRESLIALSSRGVLALRAGPWKLIPALGSGGFSRPARIEPGEGDPRGQLYEITADRAETRNLWNDRPDVVERLLAHLESERARGHSIRSPSAPVRD